jgi:uncharacterized membrane protein
VQGAESDRRTEPARALTCGNLWTGAGFVEQLEIPRRLRCGFLVEGSEMLFPGLSGSLLVLKLR